MSQLVIKIRLFMYKKERVRWNSIKMKKDEKGQSNKVSQNSIFMSLYG